MIRLCGNFKPRDCRNWILCDANSIGEADSNFERRVRIARFCREQIPTRGLDGIHRDTFAFVGHQSQSKCRSGIAQFCRSFQPFRDGHRITSGAFFAVVKDVDEFKRRFLTSTFRSNFVLPNGFDHIHRHAVAFFIALGLSERFSRGDLRAIRATHDHHG